MMTKEEFALTIKEKWEKYESFVVPKEAGIVQRQMMMLAFYAGFKSMMDVNWYVGNFLNEDEGIKLFTDLGNEFDELTRSVECIISSVSSKH